MTQDRALWRRSARETLALAQLDTDCAADLLIVGGGYTGCAAALRAAELGASVRLCEAETIGHGGAGRNVGLVNAGLWLPPEALARAMGAEPAARLTEALGQGPDAVFSLIARHDIACDPRRAGTLHCAHAPRSMAELRERHRQAAQLGAPVRLLDAEDARRATGSPAVHGALHDRRAGTIQPLSYVRGLARAAIENGAQLNEKTCVTALVRAGSAWCATTSSGRKIHARSLLIATDAYHRVITGLTLPRMAWVDFFQIATTPLGDNIGRAILPGGEGCWDTGLVMSAVRRDAAGRLILGGMGRPTGAGRAMHLAWARRRLSRMFPYLDAPEITDLWLGRIGMTADHVPRILNFGPQAFAVYGFSGRGIAPGTVLGTAVADALLQSGPDALPLTPVPAHHGQRWASLRSHLFEAGARLVHTFGR